MVWGSQDELESRFRKSIRLEATREVLQSRYGYGRQILVWFCTFSEAYSVGIVPAIHLVSNAYIAAAVFLLMFLLSCWQTASVSEVIWQPAHLLRPKDYSRFGLGRQRSSYTFFLLSLLIRFGSAIFFSVNFALFFFDETYWYGCSDYSHSPNWHKYTHSQLQSDVALCGTEAQSSDWCETIEDFERRCNDRSRWSSQLRNELGLECNEDPDLHLLQNLSRRHLSFCMTNVGVEVGCRNDSLPHEDSVFWTDYAKIGFDETCGSLNKSLELWYHCEIFFYQLDCQEKRQEPSTTHWDETLRKSCEVHKCAEMSPHWLQEISTKEELLYLCQCLSCRAWWRPVTFSLDVI